LYNLLFNNEYTEGIRRILTAAYFSATKTGKLALLQTDKNCHLTFIPSNLQK